MRRGASPHTPGFAGRDVALVVGERAVTRIAARACWECVILSLIAS